MYTLGDDPQNTPHTEDCDCHQCWEPSELAYIRADNSTLREALHLIKLHITSEQTEQNRDLYKAVGKIVDVARQHGLLLS